MPAVDIDRDAAHEAAAAELAKPIYPGRSPAEQFGEWVNDLLYRLVAKGAQLPGGWFTLTILVLIAAAMVIFSARIARRTMRSGRGEQLFGPGALCAADHRLRADRAAAQHDWTAAIRHLLRAIARELEESGSLDPVPGRTAGELAAAAAEIRPELTAEFRSAAAIFNEVSYGERPGTEAGYRQLVGLDERLRRRAATITAPSGRPDPAR